MELLSIRQAARELHVSERVLRQAVRTGALKAFKLGERTQRVERESLYTWVRSRQVPTWRNGRGQKST